jgi:hypothetical protein
VITSQGSIAGKISKRLPTILTTERGLPALRKAIGISEAAMELLDEEATLRGAKQFGASMYSVAHWAKFYTHHWYTASKACKFNLADSADCNCCNDNVNETTAHIFQCNDRNDVHQAYRRKLTSLLAEQKLPNGLLHLIEAGIDLALHSNNTHRGEIWDGDDDGNDEEKRVAQLLNDNGIPNEYKVAFRQQTIIGWEYIFTGKFARGWRQCWTEKQQWATKFAILMMKWGRACWSSRNTKLFGARNSRYLIQRRRLMAEATVWRTATRTERLVGEVEIKLRNKTLKTTASTLIATWLAEWHDLRRRIQRRKQESILMTFTDPEALREADNEFKRQINIARGLSLRTDRQGVGEQAVDTSTEEPPD